jgi:thiamine monophosphate kinase
VSNIGTSTPGTAADDTVHSITLTQTDFEAGDVLVVSNAAGTAAATLEVYGLTLKYKPDFD